MIPLIASVSGGKDSAAMCLHLQELGIEYRAVFLDTGWEAQETYDYLRGPLTEKLGPIEEVKAPLGMAALCIKKGMFPGRLVRFCTQQLKVFPFIHWVTEACPSGAFNAIGIRAGESRPRAAMTVTSLMPETGNTVCIWRPILSWTMDDVIAIHKRHDLAPNPLYLAGASRVGCWPCIYARKSEVALIARRDPARIDAVRDLEAAVQAVAQRVVPTFFHRCGTTMPIDDVVEWANTSHGGRQYQLFNIGERDGCLRWGMCEGW